MEVSKFHLSVIFIKIGREVQRIFIEGVWSLSIIGIEIDSAIVLGQQFGGVLGQAALMFEGPFGAISLGHHIVVNLENFAGDVTGIHLESDKLNHEDEVISNLIFKGITPLDATIKNAEDYIKEWNEKNLSEDKRYERINEDRPTYEKWLEKNRKSKNEQKENKSLQDKVNTY